MKKVVRSRYLLAALALIVALLLIDVLRSGSNASTVPFGVYQGDLGAGRVASATIHDASDTITGKLADGTSYRVEYPDRLTTSLVAQLSKTVAPSELKVDHSHSSVWASVLGTYLPMVAVLGLFLLLLNSSQGGASRVLKFGRAKTRPAGKDQPTVTFADVAGADEAVAELQEIKEFLEAPARFQALGATIPRGVLLFGPPGTGKTLLARAVAGEAGVPFFAISGSDFVEMFVGVGASRVRDLFAQAKASAPSIVFVDEIDAVGRHRGSGMGGGHDEREQTLNQLLVELDGFDSRGGVILIAATNRPDILDPALLRPGRFDRQIVVDRPDVTGRRQILDVHTRSKPLHSNVSLDTLAKRTPGFSGADLANLTNEAALLAARRNLRQIGMRECEEAIDRVMAGPERKTLVMSDHDKLVTAYHEGGHVLVGHVLRHADPIHKVSIVARSRSLGLTFTLAEDKYNHSRSELRDTMAMCLGGRSAEELVFLEPTTGAENDIEKVTRIARAMVTEYGMSDLVGPQTLGSGGGGFLGGGFAGAEPTGSNYSEHNAGMVDAEVRALIDGAHQRALAILGEHRGVLDDLARELVEKETLEGPDLRAIIGHLDGWPEQEPFAALAAPTPRTARAAKPAAAKPAAAKPAAAKPAVAKPAVAKPAVAKPAVAKPAVAKAPRPPRSPATTAAPREGAAAPRPARSPAAAKAAGPKVARSTPPPVPAAAPNVAARAKRKPASADSRLPGVKAQPAGVKAQTAGRVRARPRPETTD